MFFTNMLVACSVFVMCTLFASAWAFSASAFALRIVLRRVSSPISVAASPPPSITFSISLHSIPVSL